MSCKILKRTELSPWGSHMSIDFDLVERELSIVQSY